MDTTRGTYQDLLDAQTMGLSRDDQERLARSQHEVGRRPAVRENLALWGATSPEVQLLLARDASVHVRRKLAQNLSISPEVQVLLAEDVDDEVRERLALNPSASREAVLRAFPDAPVVPDLDAKILEHIDAGGGLNMSDWHTCETTHCRAGWAVVVAGERGRALEEKYGAEVAGAVVYRASTGRLPNFFASEEGALEDMRRAAAGQSVVGTASPCLICGQSLIREGRSEPQVHYLPRDEDGPGPVCPGSYLEHRGQRAASE